MNAKRKPQSNKDLKGVEYYLKPSFLISTFVFMAGLTVNFFLYLDRGRTLNAIVDGVSLLILFSVYLLLTTKKWSADRAVIVHVIVIALNFCISIFTEAIEPTDESRLWILMTIAVSIVPVLFAGMTTRRRLPLVVALAIIVSYTAASIIMKDVAMMTQIPTITLLFAAMALGYSYILYICRLTERENIRMSEEQSRIFDYFYFTPKQWEKIREGRMSRQKLRALMEKADKSESAVIDLSAKETQYDGEAIKRKLSHDWPKLTAADIELCDLILRGYSAGEIARIQGLGIQSITSRRSRLRTKLGLAPGENLNSFLKMQME